MKGSNIYELSQWLWEFGQGMPRLGGLSVAETERRRITALQRGARRGQATRGRRSRKAPKAAAAAVLPSEPLGCCPAGWNESKVMV